MDSSVVYTVEDHVDPLKKLVHLSLGTDLGKGDWNPVQRIIHAYAKANDCVIERIRKSPKKLVLEVLVKSRHGLPSKKDPMGV